MTVNKGEFGGVCNRTVCDIKPAEFYNHSTRKYYCPKCASIINEFNRKEAMEMFGHDLCTHQKEKLNQ